MPAELLSILFAELLMMLPAEEQALETAESLPPVPVGVGDDDGATEQETPQTYILFIGIKYAV